MSPRDVGVGLLLGIALIAAHLLIVFVSAYVPGLPLHEAVETTRAMGSDPTETEIRGWFEKASSLVFFANIIVPLIVALFAGALRLLLRLRTARAWVLAIVIWIAFFLVVHGFGSAEAAGVAIFLAVFGLFEFFARRRGTAATV